MFTGFLLLSFFFAIGLQIQWRHLVLQSIQEAVDSGPAKAQFYIIEFITCMTAFVKAQFERKKG